MNRLLKFRVWNLETKKWDEPTCLEVFCSSGVLSHLYDGDGKNTVIMQFTGLIDKHGREIYEKDIVKTDPEHISVLLKNDSIPKYDNGTINWYNGGFHINQYYIGASLIGEYSTCNCCPCGLEIIGNVFETPELESKLKDEDKINQ